MNFTLYIVHHSMLDPVDELRNTLLEADGAARLGQRVFTSEALALAAAGQLDGALHWVVSGVDIQAARVGAVSLR